jgi:hypothetical protein
MLLADLPLNVAKHFGNKNVILESFVDPRNHPTLGVQFVTDAGKLSDNGFHSLPHSQEFEIWKPLGGPFFRLPLAGLLWNEAQPMGRMPARKRFVPIVEHDNKLLDTTTMFAVNAPWRAVVEFGMVYQIKWFGHGPGFYCVFNNLKEYTDFLKQPFPERKRAANDENKVNVQPQISTTR